LAPAKVDAAVSQVDPVVAKEAEAATVVLSPGPGHVPPEVPSVLGGGALASEEPQNDSFGSEAPTERSTADDQAHLDADLAITLGRPKTVTKPIGNLSSKLKGRSMVLASEQTGVADEKVLADTSQLKGEYTEASVRTAWSALVSHMRAQNKVGMAATLANGDVQFEDPAIVFTVANEVQYEEFKECATELLHFVRTEAGNGGLSLEVKVAEGEVQAVFLTPKDRYLKWAVENPALETLRKRLDLDLG
jgi:hypothetical protein